MSSERREITLDDGRVVRQRVYAFTEFGRMEMWCPEESCVFCQNCTDIWYDFHGPYMYHCLKEEEGMENLTEKGHVGECPYFLEDEEEE